MIKNEIKKIISPNKRLQLRILYNKYKSLIFKNDLNKLAIIWGTDKWGDHWYTQHYGNHFEFFRKKKINLLEIGIGGYENPKGGGNSLRMWKYYFRKAQVYGLDYYDKKYHEEKRISIFQGDQSNKNTINEIVKTIKEEFDIIIDDGSHINNHVITSFNLLFPHLKKGGIYVIEDTQTSYWPNYGGITKSDYSENTTMNFFKNLIDGINYQDFLIPDYKPDYFEKNITSMHFYHNLIFIYKGDNFEERKNKEWFNLISNMDNN